MISSSRLSERIADANDRLTPTEKRLASLVAQDSTVIAFGTVAEVAARVDTSGPTVVRFATKLGFDGYPELQEEARRGVSEQLKRPADRIRAGNESSNWEERRRIAADAVAGIYDTIPTEQVRSVSSAFAVSKGTVWVVGSEDSAAAVVLASGLHQLRPNVVLLTGSKAGVASQLTDATEADTVISIDFSRYEVSVTEATRFFADLGAKVLAITDGPFSPLAALADEWCEIHIPASGPFDSALPAVALAELLVSETAGQMPSAERRIDRTEAIWASDDGNLAK